MESMATMTVYTVPPMPPKYDKVGVFYIAFCATWSFLLLAGMITCWFFRHSPVMRVRCLPLSFSAIGLLHIYWILGQITYPVGGTFKMVLAYDIQYFAMGIYFPLGIALFHASNLRFLHIAKMQKQFVNSQPRRARNDPNGTVSAWLSKVQNMEYNTRNFLFIGIGMVFQFVLAIGMWFACKKYHPTYGVPGTGIRGATLPEQVIDLGRGWEWWPSVVWQFIWAWIIAPILLWRAWGIRDTVGWRAQTIACCICSLHATPMFLIASYVPAFYKVNTYFAPSQWIHLSTFMYEIFTVFVPIFEVVRVHILSKRASLSNVKHDSWFTATMATSRSPASKNMSASTLAEKSVPGSSSGISVDDCASTGTALEHVLSRDPEPLQEFAALSDFSGENIAFLTKMAEWKSSCPEDLDNDKEQNLAAYNQALRIYTNFISPIDAEFPLNISSQALKQFQAVFERPARILYGEGSVNPATPFDSDMTPPSSSAGDDGFNVWYTGDIPEGFNLAVFDDVRDHIKYLVLTNTWPKFVDEMRRRSGSFRSRSSQEAVIVQTV